MKTRLVTNTDGYTLRSFEEAYFDGAEMILSHSIEEADPSFTVFPVFQAKGCFADKNCLISAAHKKVTE